MAAFAAAILFAAVPFGAPQAHAAEATRGDTVTIPLGKKGKGLRIKRSKIRAISPARIRGSNLILPVSTVEVPLLNQSRLVLRGGLRLKSGRRTVAIQGMLVTVRGGKASITAKVDKRRVSLFSGRSAGTAIDAATVSISLLVRKLSLTRAAAKQLNKSLRTRAYKARAVGRLKGSSKAYFAPFTPAVPGAETPNSDFGWTEPPPLERPAGALDVASATPLTVWPRTSFINYIRGGGGTVYADDGASDGPSINPGDHICPFDTPTSAGVFSFNLPFTSGWRHADNGVGAFYYSGSVHFSMPSHGLDLRFANAEVEFNGTSSRVIYRVFDAEHPAGKRGDVVSLPELASTPPVANGTVTEYQANITAVGNQALAGFYPPPSSFGCIEMGFNAP